MDDVVDAANRELCVSEAAMAKGRTKPLESTGSSFLKEAELKEGEKPEPEEELCTGTKSMELEKPDDGKNDDRGDVSYSPTEKLEHVPWVS